MNSLLPRFTVYVTVVASLALSPPVSAFVGPDEGPASVPAIGFGALRDQAEDLRESGDHAGAARAYAAAFDALDEGEMMGPKGRNAFSNALDLFELALHETSDALPLLREKAELLEHFERLRAAAQERGEVMPSSFAQELEQTRARISELKARDSATGPPTPEPSAVEKGSPVTDEPTPREHEPKSFPESRSGGDQPTTGGPPRRKVEVAIAGVGVASVVGGAALIVSGVWDRRAADRRYQEVVPMIQASSGGTEQERADLIGQYDQWRRQWRGIGTGLIVGGAMLSAVGVGLTAWGGVRMQRTRMSATMSTNGFGIEIVRRF